MKKTLFYIVLLFILGCDEPIFIEDLNIPKKFVLNAVNQPDSTWKMHLSLSSDLTDSMGINYTQALPVLKTPSGDILGEFSHDSIGYYTLNGLTPNEGSSYKIHVESTDFEAIEAECYIPLNPIPTSAIIEKGIYLNDSVFIVDLTINDRAEEENFYLINIKAVQITNTPETILQLYTLDPNTENRELVDETIGLRHIFLPDFAFNGNSYTTTFYVNFNNLLVNQIPDYPFCLQISLQSLNYDLYHYIKTYYQYISRDNFAIFNSSQEIQVHGNVENGFGIFGGYSETTATYCF